MLRGTADIEALAAGVATIPFFLAEPVVFDSVYCLQCTAEMGNEAREAVLPPSLHPTVPPAVSVQGWEICGSPWGDFQMVLTRVYCRSGARARGFTVSAFISTDDAAEGMARTFGYPAQVAHIHFRHGYDGADLVLSVHGEEAIRINATDPEPMGPDDVQYTSTLNLAQTPNGLRLVQVETHHQTGRVDRLTARMPVFRGDLLGNPLLHARQVVSGSLTQGSVEYPVVRFVCRPDELAFTGTEPVSAA